MYAMSAGGGDIVDRMRATFVVGILAVMCTRAAADDRGPVLDVEGAGGVVIPGGIEPVDQSTVEPVGVGIARAMVSWQRPRVPMPAQPGTAAWGADVAPELAVGFIGNDRRGDAFAQVGLRLHAGFAQNGMGLFQVSAQGGMYLAVRAGVVGGERSTMIEGDLGWYIWGGDTTWRLGWEIGAIGIRSPTQDGVPMPMYAAESKDVTGILHMALFLGKHL